MVDWTFRPPRLAAVAVAFFVAACAAPAPERTTQLVPDETGLPAAAEIYAVGYGNIVERYIEPIPVAKIAFQGLRGFGAIDPAFTVHEDKGVLEVHHDDRVVARHQAPGADDLDAWARLTVAVAAEARSASPILGAASDEKLYEAVFDGVLSELDVFSRYAGAAQAKRNRARREGFGGIGIRFSNDDGVVKILSIMKDAPAEGSGLLKGDRVTHVDGLPMSNLRTEQLIERFRGPIESTVVITVVREAVERPLRFNLKRVHIVPETVTLNVDDGLAIIKISSFNQNTAVSVAEALENLHDAGAGVIDGVALDLRGNPGGLLNQAARVADLFLGEGGIVSTRGRHPDSVHHYTAGGRDLARGLSTVVLIDGKSASAAEIVAAALQDRGRAAVAGTTSYGKGTVQTVIRLPNEGEITLTWSRIFAPSGYTLHGLGVRPVICTSGARGEVATTSAALVTDTLANKASLAAAMAGWRRIPVKPEDVRNELRATCPAERRFATYEFAVARRLLADHRLYAQAVDAATTPTTASRVDGAH
jgi:carboxyl-terminal processing protease